jgi:hypothetical protein
MKPSNQTTTTATSANPSNVVEMLARADAKQWTDIASRANDPFNARVLVEALDQHPRVREQRLGTYVTATLAINRQKVRYEKSREAGRKLAKSAALVSSAFMGLVSFCRKTINSGASSLAAQALPERSEQVQATPEATQVASSVPVKAAPAGNEPRMPRVPRCMRESAPVTSQSAKVIAISRGSSEHEHGSADAPLVFPVIIDPWSGKVPHATVN